MPKSKAWLYFSKSDNNTARCNICDKSITCKSGSTSNFLKHLTVHGINLRAESCTVFSHTPTYAPLSPPTSLQDVLPPDSDSSESTKHSVVSDISSASAQVPDVRRKRQAATVNPFTLAEKAKMTKEKQAECHRAVTQFVVKGLLPFSTMETPWFREMIRTLNPRYQPPSRDMLANTCIPAWYAAEKERVKTDLKDVRDVAVTVDEWF
ncbi:uncharacterized protein LOC132891894 [Neoarius graeffei]|uniref:uncharacterized protein LOC132891894 n=1 Tax=Neoarius graeffei TaxID=443677 RepID=UPI00298C8763|nr:uncharacterized protein LOC132891894 [Neoarius graeffei]